MVRDNRIKEYKFTQQTFDAATVSSTDSDHVINGQIHSVEWKQIGTAGSIALSISGTGEEIFRRNAGSGTAWQVAYPRVFGELTTGSIAGATQEQFGVNAPLVLAAGSFTSGTGFALDVTVKYI